MAIGSTIEEFRRALASGTDLARSEAEELFGLLRAETDIGQLEALLRAWSEKGYSTDEIAACAGILRRDVRRVECSHTDFIDVVGTGGSSVKTFNVSTAAAFAVAGSGLPVAKHGNRAASSATGSADALGELGLKLDADPELASRSLERHGICFMFAPHFHNLTKELAEARRNIGQPTIFNLLGPVANPAEAPFQLIGIWDPEKAAAYGSAIRELGTSKTWVVHGRDGLDEITTNGPTAVTEITPNGISKFEISPSDFGLKDSGTESVRAKSPSASAQMVLGVLRGELDGPALDLVTINAAAALFVAGRAKTLSVGREMAAESISSGSAVKKLDALIRESNR